MTWPKVFHRIWLDEPERPEFLAWKQQLAALHPAWDIRTWDDSSQLGWMRHADLMQELLRTDPFGRAPDLLRYELLWRFGGVYIDTDFEPLRAFDELLEDPRPFAGWENDRTMCTALLAAPPEHPAIGALLDGVVGRLEWSAGKPANEAIGPEYATGLWRERDDVRRMPPWAFYPVGWWEKHLLGGPYPDRTYAVHHWAKGWDNAAAVTRTGAAKVSFLVPFRDDDGSRTRQWELIRAKLEATYDAEIIVATNDELPFRKTAALNRAAEQATGDVFLVWDADTWCDPDAVLQSVHHASEGRWGRPWNAKFKLNEAATEYVLGLGPAWDGTLDHRAFGKPENRNTFQHAPPLVVSRDMWEAVHGFDQRVSGWGQEDVMFCRALRVLVGQPKAVRGTAYHLWHPRIGKSGKDLWPGQYSDAENLALVARYKQARTPEAMRALIEEGRAVTV